MNKSLDKIIDQIWTERVLGKFVYRGMDGNDLKFPLLSNDDPFAEVKDQLIKFLDLLDNAISHGYTFEIRENHFGKSSKQSLKNIVSWTRRDLNLNKIYFTSNYDAAKNYADCWQGSQLRQNIKTISSHLLQNIPKILPKQDVLTINEIYQWVNLPRSYKPIILHVPRTLDIFDLTDKIFHPNKILPLGSKEIFKKNVNGNLEQLLPDDTKEFYCSLIKPLEKFEIAKIEDC